MNLNPPEESSLRSVPMKDYVIMKHIGFFSIFQSMRNSRIHVIVSPSADSTGTHSLYTTYKDYEIMFHVSTMLPYTPNNKQQVC